MWGGGTSSEAKSSLSPRSSAGRAAALYLLLLLHHQPPEISRKARKGGRRGQKRQEVPRCADVGGRPHFLRPGRGASCSPHRDEPNVFLPTGLSLENKPLRFQKDAPVLHGRPCPCSAHLARSGRRGPRRPAGWARAALRAVRRHSASAGSSHSADKQGKNIRSLVVKRKSFRAAAKL